MTPKAAIRAEADRILARFVAAGAEPVETAILQPAAVLLDLYGEDIRARAYVTQDPLRGEQMLRPDFTVPVAQLHLGSGRADGRYAYAGEVFRRQEEDEARPNEFIQVGFEVFGGDRIETDAEVFSVVSDALSALPLRAAIGDISIIRAAVAALDTPDRRKRALLRHIWQPVRFRALLDRFSRAAPPPPDPIPAGVTLVGLRSREEIEARIEALAEEARTPPIGRAEVDRLEAILGVCAPAPAALDQLAALAGSDLAPALDGARARLDALAARGFDPAALTFEAAYGRTSLEYYTGFVFGLYAEGRDDLAAVATGGRYDLVTAILGGGDPVPAVGGVIRPEVAIDLGGAA